MPPEPPLPGEPRRPPHTIGLMKTPPFPASIHQYSACATEEHIVDRLVGQFDGSEWITLRRYLRVHRDRNPFVSANILAILNHCRITDSRLPRMIEAARAGLRQYQREHLVYHWPLRRDGLSMMADAPILGRLPALALSPDADCTCVQQVALRQTEYLPAIFGELAFYRLDHQRFRLPRCQRMLPDATGTYLTWFPPRDRCRQGKIETVDLGVDANILWFLGEFGRLDAPGAKETMNLIGNALESDLLLRAPFSVSHYYANPAMLLYLISRALVWGKISALQACRQRILQLARRIPAVRVEEKVLMQAVGCFWKDAELMQPSVSAAEVIESHLPVFYIMPLLSPFMQRFAPLEGLARRPLFQMQFCSPALLVAIFLWVEQCRRSAASDRLP